jgi:hypothetical protein
MCTAGQAVAIAEPSRRPKIAIGFFGVTRSLQWTLPSIRENIIEPARQLGDVRLFAHLYQQTHITNPRSGEDDPLDPEEYRLLECDEVRLEEPGHCLAEARYEWILSHGDAFHDGGKSLANLIHQLHSLQMVGGMISAWKPDVVVLARPDLKYHDSLGKIIASHLHLSSTALSLPDWQWYGGYNDRMTVCGSDAAKIYTNRIDCISVYLQRTGGPLPAERLLKFFLHENGILPYAFNVRASRVRASGKIVNENFSMASLGKRLRRKLDFYATGMQRYFW